MELTAVLAYPAGLSLRVVVTATEAGAAVARYETRPLTDPADTLARWSFLVVQVRVDDQHAVADSFHQVTRSVSADPDSVYRSEPRYWIPLFPGSGALVMTVGWPEAGLDPVTAVVAIGQCPFASETG